MPQVTLQQIHRDLTELKREVRSIRSLMEEEFEPADDVVQEVRDSRLRPRQNLIPHKKVVEEFS